MLVTVKKQIEELLVALEGKRVLLAAGYTPLENVLEHGRFPYSLIVDPKRNKKRGLLVEGEIRVTAYADIPDNVRATLRKMLELDYVDSGEIWYSQQKLAFHCEIGLTTLKDHLRILDACGRIKRVPCHQLDHCAGTHYLFQRYPMKEIVRTYVKRQYMKSGAKLDVASFHTWFDDEWERIGPTLMVRYGGSDRLELRSNQGAEKLHAGVATHNSIADIAHSHEEASESETGVRDAGDWMKTQLKEEHMRSVAERLGRYAADDVLRAHYKKWVHSWGMSDELVAHAAEQAQMAGSRHIGYVDRVLDVWLKSGVSSVAEAQAYMSNFRNSSRRNQSVRALNPTAAQQQPAKKKKGRFDRFIDR